MSNRFFVALAILVVGFFLYAFSVVQNANNAMLAQVADQQGKLMGMMQPNMMQPKMGHHKMPSNIQPSANSPMPPNPPPHMMPSANMAPPNIPSGGQMPVGPSSNSADVAMLQDKINKLEARLAELETSAKPILDQVKMQQKAYDEQRKQMEEAMKKVYEIPVGSSPVRGNKNAPVTLVEFSDYQCPYCSRFHSVQQELLKAYPDKVKFILKNYPLPMHPQAKPAVKAVLAAGLQGKYWEMADAILEDNSALSAEKYNELAKKIGLNMEKFQNDLKDKDAQFEKTIQEDLDLVQKIGVRGTPSFFINGRMVTPDPEAMKSRIDEILSGKK